MCVAVRIKVDFAAVAKEKTAYSYQEGKKNFAGKIRKKVNFIASGKEKTALFITVRQKVDFAAVAKEKSIYVYGSKGKSRFCSSN